MGGGRGRWDNCLARRSKSRSVGSRTSADHGAGEEDKLKIGRTLVSEEEIQQRLVEMGAEITADYEGKDLLLVAVLKGAFMVMADLARNIALPVEIDFMAVSSYGAATQTSGVVRILKDLDQEIAGRHVLIVEDIIDSGLTLDYLRRNLEVREPASLEIATLLLKSGLQRVPIDVRYTGFEIPPEFVIGYGLDLVGKYRNLPYIAVMEEE
ncbi:MAG: hypoxanthine phosphoribosyltransferase [Acidobacteria bacterium]|nr:hypoxanthine phosphoribosyltransferase [Acidobacteriota bacterium]